MLVSIFAERFKIEMDELAPAPAKFLYDGTDVIDGRSMRQVARMEGITTS